MNKKTDKDSIFIPPKDAYITYLENKVNKLESIIIRREKKLNELTLKYENKVTIF
tara:strand:- start:683 stop:847 length:165 start_codon:yes stop_codon:yes gene_type:complete